MIWQETSEEVYCIDIKLHFNAPEWASSKQGASKSPTVVTQGDQLRLFAKGGNMPAGIHSAGCGAAARVLEPTLQSNSTRW